MPEPRIGDARATYRVLQEDTPADSIFDRVWKEDTGGDDVEAGTTSQVRFEVLSASKEFAGDEAMPETLASQVKYDPEPGEDSMDILSFNQMRPVHSTRRRSGFKQLAQTHKHLLNDEEADRNLEHFKAWMLGGSLFSYRKDVEQAFQIIKMDIPDSVGGNGEVEDLVVGPAVPKAVMANILTWSSFLTITAWGYHSVEVNDVGIAQTPSGQGAACLICFFVVVTAATLIFEYQALLYILPAQSVSAGDSLPKISFDKWMALMLSVSFVLHSDIYTTAIFVARVMRSAAACSELNDRWQQLVQEGLVRDIPIMKDLTFEGVTLGAWWIMVLQMVYAFSYSIPISPNLHQPDISRAWPEYTMAPGRARVQEYHTISRNNSGHGRSLQALAESGRMSSLNWNDDVYLRQAEQDWTGYSVVAEMQRTNVRFFLFALQILVIPHLQVTYIGVMRVHAHSHRSDGADWLAVASVVLTVLSGVHCIYYEVNSALNHRRYVLDALERHKEEAQARATSRDSRANGYHWQAISLTRNAWLTLIINFLLCITFLFLFAELLWRGCMMLVVCETGLWTLYRGCIPADNITFASCIVPQ